MKPIAPLLRSPAGGLADSGAPRESLVSVRSNARRERLLDMELRMRRYRAACFGILCVALASCGPQVGWWWIAPVAVSFCAFALADRLMRRSRYPGLWIAGAWALVPLLLAEAVAATGGAASPALMWFALPATTLGARFEPRGMVLGTTYIVVLMLVSTVGMDAGAAIDHQQTLVAAVALVISTVILSGALVESDWAYRRRSTLDPLTGLFNRSALERRLAELDREVGPGEENAPQALLLCDLDHFKRVNDQLGHAVGDAVLKEVAYLMRAALRAGDSVYRVGGEEILIILPGTGAEDALEIAERLRRMVRERHPGGVAVTISIGIAVAPSRPVDTDELIERADAALYAAKASGRDTVHLGPPPVSD